MDINPDFKDLFKTLNDEKVRYLVVGAHAVGLHADPRYTKDLDVWVETSPDNSGRLWRALASFGAPLEGISEEDFRDQQLVYQIGMEPNRIDLMFGVTGVTFETAWQNRVRSTYGGVPVCFLGKSDLIRNKRATGREQDLLDVQRLTAAKSPRRPKKT